MQKRYVAVGPSIHCPFHVEALQYTPGQSMVNGYTLILLHAMSLHKETFDSFVLALLNDTQASSIRDVWCIDNPNCGRSSSLNQALLSSDEYKSHWSPFEYARAVYSFLCSDSHRVEFRSRKLIGIGHSASALSLMLLHQMKPPLAFRALILLDPAIPLSEDLSTAPRIFFFRLAKKKKDSWPSRAVARQELLNHPAYTQWDPKLVELFVRCGLRETDSDGRVTLACSKSQEQAFYSKPDNFTGPPIHIFVDICREGKIPIHLFLAKDDKTFRVMKPLQVESVKRTPHGSVTWLTGGHMLPQLAPKMLAEKVAQTLLVMNAREERLAKL